MSAGSSRRAKWVLTSPLILFSLVFVVFPVYQGVQASFYELDLQAPSTPFAGLQNYWDLFASAGFAQAARFTVGFAVTVTLLEVLLGLGLALLMNRTFPGKKALFTALLVPIMIAPALLGVTFRLLLNGDIGLIPAILDHFGAQVSLFAPDSVIPLLVVLDVVQWTPFVFLIIYAGLQSFPNEVLEAAQVDGAGPLRTLTRIVLPILTPVLAVAVFLRFVDAIRTFDVIYVLTAGGPGTKTTTMSIFIYKTAFESGQFGLAAAASTILMLALLPLVPFMVNRVSRETGNRS
ncbi:sugar ABC transporter permease [Micromonospora sp. NPDC005305]|uniref:carbohydrate ABC transporter permease n=1 Tax=Micromonospora sp. NPDC005305 TaxID=3156875 RepID=UPI0033BB4C0A